MRIRVAIAATLLLLAACTRPAPVEPGPRPGPTPVGTPVGSPVSTVIGPAGGSLAFPDGGVRLEVPAGALSHDQAVSIQEVTNHAPGRSGRAFRLGPEGVKFAKPVRLTFAYADEAVRGSAPELLRVAYQDAEGVWWMYRAVSLDPAARTLTVQTDHFSDWSPVVGLQILPREARVKVGQSVDLRIVGCYSPEPEAGDGIAIPMVPECGYDPAALSARNWSVNGTAGGNAAVGTVSATGGKSDGTAVYVAPARKPGQNPVAVSVEVEEFSPESPRFTLVSQVTVEEGCSSPSGCWSGTVDVVYKGTDSRTGEHETLSDEFLGQYTYEVTGVEHDDPYVTLLTAKGTGSYSRRHDYAYDRTEQVRCSDMRPNETEVEKAKTTIRDGGESARDDARLSLTPGGEGYVLEFRPHYVAWKGEYASWYFYKGACNPFSDTPEGGVTTRSARAGNFEPDGIEVTGKLEPGRPIQGSKTWTGRMFGFDTKVTVTWNLQYSE